MRKFIDLLSAMIILIFPITVGAETGMAGPRDPEINEMIIHIDPEWARANGDLKEGHVILQFDIAADGAVGNIEIVGSFPPGVFDRIALQAMEKWPKRPHPEGRSYEDQRLKLSFKIRNAEVQPLTRVEPEYPQRAYVRGIEGYVRLEFSITTTGTVTEIVVVEASPPGLFDRAAIQALEQWRFPPPADGEAQRSTVMLNFTIDK